MCMDCSRSHGFGGSSLRYNLSFVENLPPLWLMLSTLTAADYIRVTPSPGKTWMIGASTVADHMTSMQRCQMMNAGLVMPTTEAEMVSIRDTFTTFYNTPGITLPTNSWGNGNAWYWLGMNTLDGQGSTSISNWVWTRTRTTPATTFWPPGEPNDMGGVEACPHVVGSLALLWNDASCAVNNAIAQACEQGE